MLTSCTCASNTFNVMRLVHLNVNQRHLPRKRSKDEEGRGKRTEAGEGYSCFRLSHNNFQAVERKKGVVRCETKTNMGVEGGVVTLAWWLFSSLAAREKRERRRRTRIENDRCFRAVFDGSLYARKINRIYILYIHMYIYIESSITGIRDWITLEIERRRVFKNIL